MINRFYYLLFIFIFLVGLYGCGGSLLESLSNATTSKGISSIGSISMSSDVSKVTTGGGDTGTAEITLKITDSNGTGIKKEVTLSTTMGYLKDDKGNIINKITTNDYGEAKFYFESGDTPGNATITAQVEGVTKELNIGIVKVGAISLTADKQYLIKNGSTLLHIQVSDVYGNPASGIKVKILSSDPSILSVGLETVVTDNQGKASVYVSAGQTTQNKKVTVTAQSGDKFASLDLNILIPNSLILTVNPETINTGGEVATITAYVTDSAGNPVPQIPVSFSTTLGEVTPSVATTDVNGIAVAYLKSGNVEGDATITATAGDLKKNTVVHIIQSSVVNVPASIEVENIEADKIYIKGSGNKETSKITFIVRDGGGNPVPNIHIQFSLVGGSQGGEYLVPINGVTDANGEVSTTLKSGTKPVTVKVKAWYNDEVYTETSDITICSGPPEGKHLSLYPNHLNIAGLVKDGIEDPITARLADLYSNPVPEGTAVHFESEYAKINGAESSTTSGNETGVATASLFSQDPKPLNGVPVHVWVQAQSGNYAYISKLYVNGNTIYAGTDGGGVFKTIDDGENWNNIGKPRSYVEGLKGLWGTYINDMEVRGSLIVVATEDGGVFYSEDGGYDWKDLNSQSDRITQYNVVNGTVLNYYPVNLRERISVDNGSFIAWKIIGRQFFTNDTIPHTITYDIDYGMPSTPAKFIRILDNNTFFAYFSGKGVWKFDKTLLHWFNFNQGLPQVNISTMVLVDTNNDGSNDTIFVTIGGQVYKSSVTTANFQSVGAVQPVAFNDAYVMGTDIYYATTQGIKKFDTLTNTWIDVNFTGCPVSNIKHILVTTDGTIYIGTDVGLYRIKNGKAYPLNIYKEIQMFANESRQITLAYPSDENKTHTIIYINGIELPFTYYDFENATTISIRNNVAPIPAGAVVEVYYTLKPDNSTSYYVAVPQKEITALYYTNNKLYFGTENRKVYVLENPATASLNGELPKIRDISGLSNKITSVVYKTAEVMFSGHIKIKAYWDSDGDGFFDNGNATNGTVVVPNGNKTSVLVTISDENGRPLAPGTNIEFSCDVAKVNFSTSTLPDFIYGGNGITEYHVVLMDKDASQIKLQIGTLKIKVTSENYGETLSVPVKAY